MHEDIVDRLQRKKKGTNVVIVGVGNVALDCARILLRSTEELKETDIASHALEALEKANVKSVTIIGRRSVAQAKFSPKELREVIGLPNLDVQIDDLEVAEEDVEEMNASRPRRTRTREPRKETFEDERPRPNARRRTRSRSPRFESSRRVWRHLARR